MKGESLDPTKAPDLKEAYNVGLELAPDDPRVRREGRSIPVQTLARRRLAIRSAEGAQVFNASHNRFVDPFVTHRPMSASSPS
jgi:hypothetical protein